MRPTQAQVARVIRHQNRLRELHLLDSDEERSFEELMLMLPSECSRLQQAYEQRLAVEDTGYPTRQGLYANESIRERRRRRTQTML